MKEKSSHAQVALLIRAELRKHGIEGSVKSSSFSNGNSVDISVKDLAPWTLQAIESFCGQFRAGHFDGMTDMYEYSARRADIPQVKFVSVTNSYSDSLRQQAWDYLRASWVGFESAPALLADAHHYRVESRGEWADTLIYRVLRGSMGKFWKKPAIRIAA